MTYIILEKEIGTDIFRIRWGVPVFQNGYTKPIYTLLCAYKRYIYVKAKLNDYCVGYQTYSAVSDDHLQDAFMRHYKNYKNEKDFEQEFKKMLKVENNKTEVFKNLKESMKEFDKWYEDESFGGIKKLMRIKDISIEGENPHLCVDFLYDGCVDLCKNKGSNGYYSYSKNSKHCMSFLKNLINKKIIRKGEIYDMNDKKFVKAIAECKDKVEILLSDERRRNIENSMISYHKNYPETDKLFCTTVIINNKYHSRTDEDGNYDIYDACIRPIPLYDKIYDVYYLEEFFPWGVLQNFRRKIWII
jgi:hypothetical protein